MAQTPDTTLRLLYPESDIASLEGAYDDAGFGEPWPDRPYTVVNMISTVDGRARIGADTSELGDDVDLRLLIKLREQADCVLAGPRTIEIERYKGPASRAETRAAREARGLRPRPLLATVVLYGEPPWRAPVFQDPEAECVVFSAEPVDASRARAKIIHVSETDPRAVARVLRERFDVRVLLIEGGPSLNAVFFSADLVDELFLTVAPLVVGGADPFPIVLGELAGHVPLRLRGAMLDDEQHLYLRYLVERTGDRRPA